VFGFLLASLLQSNQPASERASGRNIEPLTLS